MPTSIFGYPVYPKFSLDGPRYPQNTFLGRFLTALDVIDPRTLLASDKDLDDASELLQAYKIGILDETVPDSELWQARKLRTAILHPNTGDKVPAPFRMSGFIPFNTPIMVGLLQPNPSLAAVVFWQWLNQSHNACINYSNRNASRPTTWQRFAQGYTGACSAAVGIGVGLNLALSKAESLAPATRTMISRFLPLPAICAASTINALIMRAPEKASGIHVHDASGKDVGVSKEAARRAVRDTAISRFCLPIPLILFPSAVMSYLQGGRLLRRFPRLTLPINAAACTAAFAFALPGAIALFPQTGSIAREDLEPELRDQTKAEILYYNKGL